MLTRLDRLALALGTFAGLWALLMLAGYLAALQPVAAAVRRALGVM